MHIKRADDVPSVATPHGELIHELIGKSIGGGINHSIAKITLPTGKASRKHYHPIAEESYYILSGTGAVKMDDDRTEVHSGDAIAIPKAVVHQIFNTGGTPLVFLAICAPPWTPDNSVYLD